MERIFTRKGEEILVDEEDYEFLNSYCSWRIDPNTGYVVGTKREGGKRFNVLMHRLIMKDKIEVGQIIDHKDRNRRNNMKENLRPSTYQQNNFNKIGHGESGYKGVYKVADNRYKMKIMHNGEGLTYTFNSSIACANAYNYFAKIFFGEFAYQNEVPFMDKEEWQSYMNGGKNYD